MLLQDSFSVNTSSSAVAGNLAGPQIVLFDDFVSISAQFETFRIRGIRFDVYDINPTNVVAAWFSTFHDEFGASAQPVFASGSVIDGPDSQIVPPGTGKITLYWRATGTNENRFVTTDQNSVSFPPAFFGGLRYALPGSTTGGKFQVVVKAIVDFRGRF